MNDIRRSWALALAISLVLHGGLLLSGRVAPGDRDGDPANETAVRLTFRSSSPHTVPASSAVEAPSAPREAPAPAQTPARHVQPSLLRESMPPEQQPPVHQEAATPASASLPVPDVTAPAANVAQVASLSEVRRAYEQRLLAHIEAHKHYPAPARRRGMEGRVEVALLVVGGGGASALDCRGGPEILRAAACDAVRRAEPLPLPPEGIVLPVAVRFDMEFALR